MPWRYHWIACLVYSRLWVIIRKTEFILKIKYWKINKWNCSCMFSDCRGSFYVSSSLFGVLNFDFRKSIYLFCRLQVELYVLSNQLGSNLPIFFEKWWSYWLINTYYLEEIVGLPVWQIKYSHSLGLWSHYTLSLIHIWRCRRRG